MGESWQNKHDTVRSPPLRLSIKDIKIHSFFRWQSLDALPRGVVTLADLFFSEFINNLQVWMLTHQELEGKPKCALVNIFRYTVTVQFIKLTFM
jgi:hypothetical protein